MRFKLFSKKFVIAIAFLLFVVVFVFNIARDIDLRDEIAKLAIMNVPDITMQNISFERNMFGADWSLHIVSMERTGDVTSIYSVDAYRKTASGDIARFTTKRAKYIEKENIIEMPEGGTLTWVTSGD